MTDKSFENVRVATTTNRGEAKLDGKNLMQTQSFNFKAGQFYKFSGLSGGAHHVVSKIKVDLSKIKPDLICN